MFCGVFGSCFSLRSRGLTTLVVSLVLLTFSCTRKVQGVPFPAPDFKNCNNSQGCCPPPYNGALIQDFYVFDPTLPMRIRQPAHLLDDAYIAKYQRAYQLLRELPDSDGRSWKNQGKLHCAYCNAAFYFPDKTRLEIHYGWLFFAWHRFFLYFHERILAKLLDDDTFALPFWNWDNQSPDPPLANVLPYAFAYKEYQNKSSSLYDVNRNVCTKRPNIIDLQTTLECVNQTATFKASLREANNRIMYNQMVSGAPIRRLFFGESYELGGVAGLGAGTMEAIPHGPVHFWVGNPKATVEYADMGIFQFSAYDPTFFAHHGNVDRLWEVWKALPGGNRKDITDSDYLNTEFLFYDENANLVKVKISQALNHISTLRYKYANVPNLWIHSGSDAAYKSCFPASTSEINKMILNTPALNTSTVNTFANSTITFSVQRPAKKQLHAEEVLVIGGLNVTAGEFKFLINAFLYFPTANVTTSITCPQFFGVISNTALMFGDTVPESKKDWRLALTSKLQSLSVDQFSHVVVTLVEATGDFPKFVPLKLTAKIEYFEY
jgi:polyphenol oxidase